jgi:hypothetical protein
MKTMLLAAAAGLSLAASTAVAYADGGQGIGSNTFFTQLPGVVAQADVPNAPTYAQNRPVQSQQAHNGAGGPVEPQRLALPADRQVSRPRGGRLN